MKNFDFAGLWTAAFDGLRGNWLKAIGVFLFTWVIECATSSMMIVPFLLLPLNFGFMLFYLKLMRHESASIENIFEPFREYFHYLWGAIRPAVFIFLWTLLFIIPGIIAAYRYAMTSFIMLDKPELSVKEAMEKSCRLMKGYKLKLFGYSLLMSVIAGLFAILTLGIGLLWLTPFVSAFYAGFYLRVKAAAEGPDASVE